MAIILRTASFLNHDLGDVVLNISRKFKKPYTLKNI